MLLDQRSWSKFLSHALQDTARDQVQFFSFVMCWVAKDENLQRLWYRTLLDGVVNCFSSYEGTEIKYFKLQSESTTETNVRLLFGSCDSMYPCRVKIQTRWFHTGCTFFAWFSHGWTVASNWKLLTLRFRSTHGIYKQKRVACTVSTSFKNRNWKLQVSKNSLRC